MFRIKTMNKISPKGLAHLPSAQYAIGDDVAQEQAILVRSAKLHDYDFPTELLAIARAGAGVNNIPLDRCADAGIVVFNTPGANANAVKELAICALLLTSRNIIGGSEWVKQQAADGADVAAVVEKGKSAFAGCEITGKTLGVVGLGAIGILTANAAIALGMDVVAYDPYLAVPAALTVSPKVKLLADLAKLYQMSDYISLHLPMNADTKASINKDAFAQMKDGVRIINMARGELVHNADMAVALESGKVTAYATDFPDSEITLVKGVVPIPHLGASSEESEENCAEMAAMEISDYLENGNIVTSVNLPCLSADWATSQRICVLAKGTTILADATALLGAHAVACASVASKSRGEYNYLLLDSNDAISPELTAALAGLAGVLRVRILTR